jgi:hypothetical protein
MNTLSARPASRRKQERCQIPSPAQGFLVHLTHGSTRYSADEFDDLCDFVGRQFFFGKCDDFLLHRFIRLARVGPALLQEEFDNFAVRAFRIWDANKGAHSDRRVLVKLVFDLSRNAVDPRYRIDIYR